MRSNNRLVSLAVLALGAAIALGGCKKSETPATNNPQPAAASAPGAAPADQTAQSTSSQPVPAAQPATSSQPAPAAPPAPTDQAAGTAAPAPASAPTPAAPVPPEPTVVILPKGTLISVRLDQDLGSKISQTGQNFRATVASAVKVSGQTLVPVGSRADGVVTDAEPLGKIKGEARLAVTLQRIHTPWGGYPVATSSIARVEKGKGKRTAVMGGGGAGLGAIIGGIAGGGKGALVGGLVGGGAGTAGSAFTGNKQIVLPTETLLTFRLQQPVHITTDNGQ
jgi:hypothetical protein